MAYCSECGSEIAENDIFCPYCGISLPRLPSANDVSHGGAIIIENSENDFIKTRETESSEAIAPQISQINHFDEAANTTDGAANNFSTAAADENFQSQNDSVKIPQIENETNAETEISNTAAPERIEILKPLGEDLPIEKEANENAMNAAAGAESNANTQTNKAETSVKDQPEIVSDIGEKEKSAETQNESSIMNYEEAEVKEGAEVYDAELNNETPAPEMPEDADFTATMPYISNDLKGVENFSPQNYQPIQNQAAASEIVSEQKEISSPQSLEPNKIIPEPIAKPAVELETPPRTPSQFDSVRIMERKEKVSEPAEETKVEPLPENKPSPENVSAPQNEQKEARSYTTPNIGTTDTDGKKSPKLKPLEEGTVLNGRYEIVRKIGGGGMGAVYLASDKNLGGVLRAVKEMVQSYIEDEQQEKAVNDFKRESLLLTSLEHQSIPTIYDYFYDETEARFYLVMKYISGGDLASRLRAAPVGKIDEQSITEWAIQIADVLDYLHNRQPPIVYRDLKPANIMIDGNTGRCMLIDFGIARWVNKEEKGVTAVGTMGYAPPELFSGNVEPRSDIYSLGSTMFHLLTGADPQSNPLLIFDFQKHPRPRQINPQLSDEMERILMRAVEYNADKRFASAAELRSALEEHLKKLKSNKATFGVKDAPVSVALSDQPVFCGFCGQKIVATDMFCAFCGAKQPLAQEGVQSEKYVSPTPTAQLLIVGTNELEVPAFRIEKDENLVGRRDPMSNIFPEVDLSKYDPQTKISRKHARIWRKGSEFLVEDLGSSNGTLVLPVVSDTVRLQPHKPYVLTNGDKLKLGDTTLHFVIS